MMQVPLGDTYYFKFTTRAFATGVPTALAGTPVLSAYEENNVTQITAGVSVTADYDSVVGLNEAAVVATSGNGYEVGKYYDIVITTGTVGGVSVVGEVVGHFRAMAAEGVAGVPDANTTHVSDTSQTGNDNGADINTLITQVGTAGDGLTAINLPNQTMDIVGSITGNLSGSVGSVTGAVGSVTADVGIDAGAVDDIWDEVINGGAHNTTNSAGRRLRLLAEAGFYTDGFVFLDTVGGTAGDTDFENGTEVSATNLIASVNTILASLNLYKVDVAPGSSVTFAASQTGQIFRGHGWNAALGGQDITGTHIFGASVSGISTASSECSLHDCHVASAGATLRHAHLDQCGLIGTVTIGVAGDYILSYCYSEVAGAGSPVLDMNSVVGATNVSIRGFKGGLTVNNLTTDHVLTIGGEELGTITLNGADASVEIRGIYKALTNSLTGSPTVNTDGAIKGVDVASILTDTAEIGTAGAGLTDLGGMSTAMQAEILAEVDAALDTAISELGVAAPTATPTMRTGLMLLYMALRNKTIVQTSGTDAIEFHNDAGTKITQKLLTDDGSDMTEAEMS